MPGFPFYLHNFSKFKMRKSINKVYEKTIKTYLGDFVRKF